MCVHVHIYYKFQSWILGNHGLTGYFKRMPSYPSMLSLGYSLSSSAPFFFKLCNQSSCVVGKMAVNFLISLISPFITHFALSIYFEIPSSFAL